MTKRSEEVSALRAEIDKLEQKLQDERDACRRELRYWRDRTVPLQFVVDSKNALHVFPIFHRLDQVRLRSLLEDTILAEQPAEPSPYDE